MVIVRDVGLAMLIGLLASLPAGPEPRSTDHPVAFESETGRAHVREAEQHRLTGTTLASAESDWRPS
jgi:hypothetical protein